MKQNTHAGMSGKGFYAALTLSAAMVGAACWYAYSEAGKLTPPAAPEHQYSAPQTTQNRCRLCTGSPQFGQIILTHLISLLDRSNAAFGLLLV